MPTGLSRHGWKPWGLNHLWDQGATFDLATWRSLPQMKARPICTRKWCTNDTVRRYGLQVKQGRCFLKFQWIRESMRRTISSAQTFFMTWVFPFLWIGGFGFGTCAHWIDALRGGNGVPPPVWMKWQYLVIWLVVSSFILWFCGRLKRLRMDDEALYVSNYWAEERVPLTEVSHFTRSRFTNPPTVTIHLRSMSPYGERIVFIPKHRWALFGTHPAIAELQALCDRAKGNDGTGETPRPI